MAKPKVPSKALRDAFERLMAEHGKPVTFAGSGRNQVYRLADGKTVRLRTNNLPALVGLAKSEEASAPMGIEAEDFLGVVFRAGENRAVGYLVPMEVAVAALRLEHERWLAEDPAHKQTRHRLITFLPGDGPSYGYDTKWAKYRIGEIAIGGPDLTPPRSRLAEAIERCRGEITAAAVAEGHTNPTVNISVGF